MVKVTVREQQIINVAVNGIAIIRHDIPVYNGVYNVVPSANQKIMLETADKLLTDNITVKEIPYYETSNIVGGNTVYIGSEVEING